MYVDEMINYNTTKHETNIEKGAGLCLKFPSWSLTFTFVFDVFCILKRDRAGGVKNIARPGNGIHLQD